MSRIGKQPVVIPSGVDVTIEGQNVSVKGPKGTLELAVAEPITVSRNDDGAIVVARPDDERRTMLADHGRAGGAYPQVQTNTVASFALGDYEWLLALEADDPLDLVDLMRHLRSTEARRHVREEVPFFTGRRVSVDELGEVLT